MVREGIGPEPELSLPSREGGFKRGDQWSVFDPGNRGDLEGRRSAPRQIGEGHPMKYAALIAFVVTAVMMAMFFGMAPGFAFGFKPIPIKVNR